MADAVPQPPKLFAQWRVIALVFGALTIGLSVWYFFALRDDYTVLYRDLRPNDAAAISANLGQRSVRHRAADNGRQILVPASQLELARSAVGSSGAEPHNSEGFELFDQSDMGLNDFAERIRYQRAIQGELERTIMMMDGVTTARVHISMPDRTPFRGEQQSTGAAVTVVTRTPQDQTSARVEGIQRLVAAAVTGLTAADVVVLNGRGEVLSPRVEITTVSSALLGGDGQARRTAIDLVTQIMREALPDRQFEISIEQAEALPTSTGATSPGAPLAAPATNTPVFTRIIKVATETALTDVEKQRVRAFLHNGGLVDGSLEQTVLFNVGLSADLALARHAAANVSQLEAGASISAATSARAPAPRAPTLFAAAAWLLAVLLSVAVFVVALVVRRGRHRPALTAPEHEQFANRLRSALQAQTEADLA